MDATPATMGRHTTPAHLEPLEQRRLLSVSLTEAEPNNTRAQANAASYTLANHLLISGKLSAAGDHDSHDSVETLRLRT